MERGKEICRMLKEIRRQIAKANDIEFVTSECKHRGDCVGTCPKCESEVEYLEQQLARRRRLGLTTRVAGLALGLAAIAPFALVDSCTKGDLIGPEALQGDVAPDTMGIVGPDNPADGQDGQEGQEGQDGQEGQN